MNITEDLYKAHEQLSTANLKYLDFINRHPEGLKLSTFDSILKDKRMKDFHFQPWPVFLKSELIEEVRSSIPKVFNLIKSIPERFFDSNPARISRYYEETHQFAHYALFGADQEHLDHILGRGDYIMSPSKGIKCIEFNVSGALGGWEMDIAEQLYINNPLISSFLEESRVNWRKNNLFDTFLEHILDRVLMHFDKDHIPGNEINAAIAIPDGNENNLELLVATLNEFYIKKLENKIPGISGQLYLRSMNKFQVEKNTLMLEGKRILILLEWMMGDIPLLIMETAKNKELFIYNGPISIMLTSKLNMALLSENVDSGLFDKDEQEIINKYIPWTRKVIPVMEGEILANRENLVLKPSDAFGGKGVCVGAVVSPETWKETLKTAIESKKWIAQEYIQSPQYLFQDGEDGYAPSHMIYGFFVFGSRYAGGYGRILPAKGLPGVVNVSQGARENIILEVEN